MALIKCPECGKEVSDKAPVCIHCGYPLSDVKVDTRLYDIIYYGLDKKNGLKIQLIKYIRSSIPSMNLSECVEILDNPPKALVTGITKESAENAVRMLSQYNCDVRAVPSNDTILHDSPFQNTGITLPKCPTCGSTNIQNISLLARGASAYAFGMFSKTARSQFKCNNCGYKW